MNYWRRFLIQFVLAPIALCLAATAGPSLALRLWALLDLCVSVYGLSSIIQRSGWLKSPPSDQSGQPVDALKQLCERLGLESVPQLAIVDAELGYDNAAVRAGSRPVVYVSRRLLDWATPEVLRAVLAHELGHLTRANRAIQAVASNVRWWSLIVALLVVFAVPAWQWALALWMVARVGGLFLSRAIHRAAEMAADRTAIRMGEGLGLLPVPEWRAEEKARRDARMLSEELPEWLSTHPSAKRRAAQVHALMGAAQPSGAEPTATRR